MLVPWDLPKVPEIGTGVEVLLYTGLKFDGTKVVQVKVGVAKIMVNPTSLNLKRTLPISEKRGTAYRSPRFFHFCHRAYLA